MTFTREDWLAACKLVCPEWTDAQCEAFYEDWLARKKTWMQTCSVPN